MVMIATFQIFELLCK